MGLPPGSTGLLASAGKTRILRHVKVPSALNAYAPEWQEYLSLPQLRESRARFSADSLGS